MHGQAFQAVLALFRNQSLVGLLAAGALLGTMLGCTKSENALQTYLAQANSADVLGRPDWVRHYLEKALALEPAQPQALARLGNAQLAGFEGSVQKGIEALRRSLELQPNHVSTSHDLASALLYQGQPEQALAVLKPLQPEPATLILRAEALMLSDAQAAFELLEQALEQASDGEKPFAQAAEAARILSRWQDAAKYAALAGEANPWNPAHAYAEAFARGQLGEEAPRARAQEVFTMLKAYTAIKGDTGEQALEKLALIDRLEPLWRGPKASLHAHRLYLQIRAGRQDAAKQTWNQVAPVFAMKLEEKHQLVVTLMQAGWHSRAAQVLASLEPAQAALPNSVVLQAQLALHQQRFETMASLLSDKIAKDATLAPYFHWRGKAHQWLEQEESALTDLQEAVRLAPWMATYRITLANAYLGLGQKDQALACLQHDLAKRDPQVLAFSRENGLELAP